jgi:hypothetical protein
MSGFALLSNFACQACGSPAIVLPEKLGDGATVRCSGCGGEIGTWGAFKARARQLIMADIVSGARDPRTAGIDLALKV